jgi:hypothetical protein
MRLTLPLLALVLTGCVRTMQDASAFPVTDDMVSTKAVRDIRDCLVPIVSGSQASPIETGTDEQKTLAFTSGTAGVFLSYSLAATTQGTRVIARRRGVAGDNFEKARACYAV